MTRFETRLLPSVVLTLLVISAAPLMAQQADDLDGLQEKVMKAAMQKVAPCVVQIQTSGGLDIITAGPAVDPGPQPKPAPKPAAEPTPAPKSLDFNEPE